MAKEIDKAGFWKDQWRKIQTLPNEWISLLILLFRPAVVLPLAIAVLALYLASTGDVSKEVKLILNIVASLASGVAAGFMVDWWKDISGNTIAVKKGQSAIRNLTLIREKAKNIAERTRSKGNLEEIGNLLTLLEKDLGNSIKDWNDILPAVLEIEAIYASLDQKESENETVRSELEALKTELEKEKTWKANEKEELKQLIASKEKEAADLRAEIYELKRRTSTVTSTLASSATIFPIPVSTAPWAAGSITAAFCKKCGNLYQMRALGENGLCDQCNAKQT
jgi:hypothetical protein